VPTSARIGRRTSTSRVRPLPPGFIAPCLPSSAPQPPCGAPRGPAQRYGILVRGWSFADTGKALEAVQTITSGISTLQLTGAAVWMPVSFAHLTKAYAELGQSDDDWRCIAEAMATMKTTREKAGGRPRSIGWPVKPRYSRRSQTRRKWRRVSSSLGSIMLRKLNSSLPAARSVSELRPLRLQDSR